MQSAERRTESPSNGSHHGLGTWAYPHPEINVSKQPGRRSRLTHSTFERPVSGLTGSQSLGRLPRSKGHSRTTDGTSNTWTTSSGGDFSLLAEGDEVEDRHPWIEEYNRLATKYGVRPIVPGDFSLADSTPSRSLPDKRGTWVSRVLRQSSGQPNETANPGLDQGRLQHRRNTSDVGVGLNSRPRKDSLKDENLASLVRICGKSLFYLPTDYAACPLVLPTCFRATAQALVQQVDTRGIFRVPGSLRAVNSLYDYYCADRDEGEIACTTRCPNLPAHIHCSPHDIATVFKRFLSGLPGGILGSLAVFDSLVAIHSQLHSDPEVTRTKETKLRARLVALAIGTVKSRYQRELICAVFGLLCLIGRTAEKAPREDDEGRPLPTSDLMGYNALGIIFGPLLVGDLLDLYIMKLADPAAGLVLLPFAPQTSRKRGKRGKRSGHSSQESEQQHSPSSAVDKIHIANSIAEMLITHWREVARQLRSLDILKPSHRTDSAGGGADRASFQTSASEAALPDHVCPWEIQLPESSNDSPALTLPKTTMNFDLRQSSSSQGDDSDGLSVKRQRPRRMLSPTAEEIIIKDITPETTPDLSPEALVEAPRFPSRPRSRVSPHTASSSMTEQENREPANQPDENEQDPNILDQNDEAHHASSHHQAMYLLGDNHHSLPITPTSKSMSPFTDSREFAGEVFKSNEKASQADDEKTPRSREPFRVCIGQRIRLPQNKSPLGPVLSEFESSSSINGISEPTTSTKPQHSDTEDKTEATRSHGITVNQSADTIADSVVLRTPGPESETLASSSGHLHRNFDNSRIDIPTETQWPPEATTPKPLRRQARDVAAGRRFSSRPPDGAVKAIAALFDNPASDMSSGPVTPNSKTKATDQPASSKDVTPTGPVNFALKATGVVFCTPKEQPPAIPNRKMYDRDRDLSEPPRLGAMVPFQEQPPIAQHVNFSRPQSVEVYRPWKRMEEQKETGLHNLEPGRSNSLLHTRIRSLQRQLKQRDEELNHLRRQLETREDVDVGTLSEQLREAKRECEMWRQRAKAAENRLAMYERFTARMPEIRDAISEEANQMGGSFALSNGGDDGYGKGAEENGEVVSIQENKACVEDDGVPHSRKRHDRHKKKSKLKLGLHRGGDGAGFESDGEVFNERASTLGDRAVSDPALLKKAPPTPNGSRSSSSNSWKYIPSRTRELWHAAEGKLRIQQSKG